MYVLQSHFYNNIYFSHCIIGKRELIIIMWRNKDWSQINFETYCTLIYNSRPCLLISDMALSVVFILILVNLSEPLLLSLQPWTPQWKGIRLRLTFAATSMRAIFARPKCWCYVTFKAICPPSLLSSPLPFLLSLYTPLRYRGEKKNNN